MPQPDFVPLNSVDRVRPSERLPVPDPWTADRPAEIDTPHQPTGRHMGVPGPDQGYGIKLAKHFADQLQLAPNEHLDDAIQGCLAVGLKRAALFGRAPVIHDFEHAYALWGFIGSPPPDLVALRATLFEAASHHYEDQRHIADAVPEATLRLTPAQIHEQIDEWQKLIKVDEH